MLNYYRYFLIFLIPVVLLYSATSHANSNATSKTLEEVHITVVNNTQYSLTVINKGVTWGHWLMQPQPLVQPYAKDAFVTRGTLFAGTEGQVEYSILEGSFAIYWSLSHWGVRDNKLTINDPKGRYKISCERCNTSNMTIYVNEKKPPVEYNVLMLSDPQAWRLDNEGHDPNNGKAAWEAINQKVAASLNKIEQIKNFPFAILNGDITEFGRAKTRASFDAVYTQQLKTKILFGLGNHDYANNVNDCTEPDYLDFSKNACARGAFFDVIKRMEGYKLFLERYSDDYNRTHQEGSGAYSWDHGDIHYVQLHNYPTYRVTLDHYVNSAIHVNKSLDWLEDDLRKAFVRGKATVLNLHDAYDHIGVDSTQEERQRLRNMVKNYNVLAVFSGHSHSAGEASYGFFGSVKHYNSGALYNGDFLISEVTGKCITVSRYKGDSGEPRLISSYPAICGK